MVIVVDLSCIIATMVRTDSSHSRVLGCPQLPVSLCSCSWSAWPHGPLDNMPHNHLVSRDSCQLNLGVMSLMVLVCGGGCLVGECNHESSNLLSTWGYAET